MQTVAANFAPTVRASCQQDTRVSSGAILFLCYFAIFIQDPVPNVLNELRIVSHTGAATETSVVCFIGFHPT